MRAIRESIVLVSVIAAGLLLPRAAGQSAQSAGGNKYIVYVGTYTQPGKSQGIYAWRFQAATGHLEPLGLAAEMTNPSFLAIHPNGRFLYAVGEAGNRSGQRGGAVAAFRIDRSSGKLEPLNTTSSGGPGPCFIAVDKTGKNVLVANYAGGSVEVLPLADDGKLGAPSSFIQHTGKGPNPRRQEGPHAHSVNLSPDNRFALVADLGLDRVLVYRFDAGHGKLTPNQPPYATLAPGSGPRHLAFAPDGRTAYVISELAQTVTAFRWDAASGVLTEIGTTSTLPAGVQLPNNSTAEVLVHPSGRFVYGSNRGHDSIAVFAVARDGTLELIQHQGTQGKTPRNFRIDPTGRWLFAANQDSDSVVVFRLDPRTGRLSPAGNTLEVGSPVCIKFLAVD